MKNTLLLTSFILSLCTVSTAHAGSKWQGSATNSTGNFNYGKVTFTVEGKVIKNLKIEGVTTSGCGGYKNVLVPRLNIKGTKFSGSYVPVPGLDDIVVVSGTIRGNTATGVFSEGPLCQNDGKFTAKKK